MSRNAKDERAPTAAERKLIESMRAALATFDRADPGRADRHADDCPCSLCAFVRSCREIVALDTEPPP